MNVESASMDDLPALVDAWVSLANEQRDHGSRLRAEQNRTAIRQDLAAHIATDSVLIAVSDSERVQSSASELIGFVSYDLRTGGYETDRDVGVIHNVWVEPSHRREGIGSALLSKAEDRLAERGADVVTLEVMAANSAARRLYRRRGYKPHRVELVRPLPPGNDTHTK